MFQKPPGEPSCSPPASTQPKRWKLFGMTPTPESLRVVHAIVRGGCGAARVSETEGGCGLGGGSAPQLRPTGSAAAWSRPHGRSRQAGGSGRAYAKGFPRSAVACARSKRWASGAGRSSPRNRSSSSSPGCRTSQHLPPTSGTRACG
eukprot:6425847-Prymnesium_polylepis.1